MLFFNSVMDLVQPCSISLASPFPQLLMSLLDLCSVPVTRVPPETGLGQQCPAVWAGNTEEVKHRGREEKTQPGCSMTVDLSNVKLSNFPQHRTAGEKTGRWNKRGGGWWRRRNCVFTPKGSRKLWAWNNRVWGFRGFAKFTWLLENLELSWIHVKYLSS